MLATHAVLNQLADFVTATLMFCCCPVTLTAVQRKLHSVSVKTEHKQTHYLCRHRLTSVIEDGCVGVGHGHVDDGGGVPC